jgi:hypothetical protein
MIFDFTPDPKVLLALTRTPMQPLDALCELIDNAIDSFAIAKIQGIVIDNPLNKVTFMKVGGEDSNTETFLRQWLEDVVAIEELGEDASELKFPPKLEGGK